MNRAPTSSRRRSRLLRWLREPAGGALDDERDPGAWDRWLLRLLDPARVVDVDGVLVDRRVLQQRFACASGRCVGPARGPLRSCCADVAVSLVGVERRALRRQRTPLLDHLWRHEPALRPWLEERRAWPEPFVEGDGTLARPRGRCVFSRLDPGGGIRCRLRSLARRHAVARLELQPLACALFPLILVETSPGRLLLGLVAPDNHRLLGHHAPRRYPCLEASAGPLLVESMGADLEALLGADFARSLKTAALREP